MNFKTLAEEKIALVHYGLQDQMGGPGRERCVETVCIQHDNKVSATKDLKMNWFLLRTAMISSAVESCEQKWFRMAKRSKKRASLRSQDVKQTIRATKISFQGFVAKHVVT